MSEQNRKFPAFKFYVKDFMADANVLAMTDEEVGVYIRLLCVYWNEDGLPADIPKLAKILKRTPRQLQRIWPAISICFSKKMVEGVEKLFHKRLENERERLVKYSCQQSDFGRS